MQPDGVRPLTGLRVVEVASFISGPFAGMMLADLGADVIKVEPPRGDPFRHFGRPSTYVSAMFANCNHGKRSVVLDLKSDADRDVLLRLLDTADVYLCNWRPQVSERLGLDDAALAERNPLLVRLYITGFGPDGPLADQPAFDTVVQARSGLMHALAPGDEPVVLPGYPVDKLTSMMAVQSVLAALVARDRTGAGGTRIDLSMLDATGYVDFVDLFPARAFVDHAPADGRNRHTFAVRPLPTSDGWLVVAPVSSSAIRGACEAAGHREWADEVLAADGQEAMVRALFDRLATVTPSACTSEWLARFAAVDVPVSPCLGMDAHLTDEPVVHAGLYEVAPWYDAGLVRTARYPAMSADWGRLGATSPAPRLGADSDAIRAEVDAR